MTLPASPSSCWVRRGSAVDALSAGASSGQLLQRDPPTGEPRHGPTLQETTRRFMDLRRTKWKLAPRLPTWRRNEVAGGTQREFPCTSTRGLVDRRDSNRRCPPKSLPARAAARRNETATYTLEVGISGEGSQLPWAKKRRRYPRSPRHFRRSGTADAARHTDRRSSSGPTIKETLATAGRTPRQINPENFEEVPNLCRICDKSRLGDSGSQFA